MIWTYLRACYGFNMRVWVGGVETIYPARWFFCDPGAEYFPSPHGAEASPWLKQFEINKEWGDDNTLKKLDRGINPGYPGVCSVGKAQWFIDGQLPAEIITKEGPVTPFCCGHTPAESLDPRCPPYHVLVPCSGCEDGFGYSNYIVTATGGSGPYTIFNGKFVLNYAGACLWVGGDLGGVFIELQVAFGIALIQMAYQSLYQASWSNPMPYNCKIPQPHWNLIGFYPLGDPPTLSLE